MIASENRSGHTRRIVSLENPLDNIENRRSPIAAESLLGTRYLLAAGNLFAAGNLLAAGSLLAVRYLCRVSGSPVVSATQMAFHALRNGATSQLAEKLQTEGAGGFNLLNQVDGINWASVLEGRSSIGVSQIPAFSASTSAVPTKPMKSIGFSKTSGDRNPIIRPLDMTGSAADYTTCDRIGRNVKFIGWLLLLSGWVIVLSALDLFSVLALRVAFVAAGILTQALGLSLLMYGYVASNRRQS